MLNAKRKGSQREQPILKARAGVIPESYWIEIERCTRIRRTKRIARTIRVYAKQEDCISEERAIVDILADVEHFCSEHELSFEKLINDSRSVYEDEVALEKSFDWLS